MLDWLKYKKILEDHKPSEAVAEPAKLTRDELIAQARSNAQIAREVIGEEKLSRIRELIEKSQNQPTSPKAIPPVESLEPSPMIQAQEILKKIDHKKMLHFLRTLREKNQSH